MAGVDEIIRQWVQQVEATGELARNPNFGKPLNLDDGYLETPEELRMAFKILKDAGYVPAEVELLRQLAEHKERLNAAKTPAEQATLRSEVALLQQKVTMMLDRMARKR